MFAPRVESPWGRDLAQFPGTGCATLPANVHKTLVLVVHRFPVDCRRSWPSRSTPSSTGLAACVMHPRAASRETVWTDKRHHITRLAPALRPTLHRVRRGDHQAPPVNVREGRVSQLERLGSSRGSRTKNSIPAHRPVARPTATSANQYAVGIRTAMRLRHSPPTYTKVSPTPSSNRFGFARVVSCARGDRHEVAQVNGPTRCSPKRSHRLRCDGGSRAVVQLNGPFGKDIPISLHAAGTNRSTTTQRRTP